MIISFSDQRAAKIFERIFVKGFPTDLQRVALRKLDILNAAQTLEDLRIPPGNRLEKLSGNRFGQHSIRINDQFRICFVFKEGNAYDVEITDYHS